jgi:hypothetical protein
MIHINFLAVLVAALIPLIIGFVWYNPIFLGNAWMKAADMNIDKMKGANMPLVFGLTFVFSFFIAMAMNFMVIHQMHLASILMNEPGFGKQGSEIDLFLSDFIQKYGNNFRTFKHGVFHGTIGGIMLALPVIGVNALFERKGAKYIAINAGFWVVCFALMGGIISAWQ